MLFATSPVLATVATAASILSSAVVALAIGSTTTAVSPAGAGTTSPSALATVSPSAAALAATSAAPAVFSTTAPSTTGAAADASTVVSAAFATASASAASGSWACTMNSTLSLIAFSRLPSPSVATTTGRPAATASLTV